MKTVAFVICQSPVTDSKWKIGKEMLQNESIRDIIKEKQRRGFQYENKIS